MWLYSPIIYGLFTQASKKFKNFIFECNIEKKKTKLVFFDKFRKINNILLAIYSGVLTFYSVAEIGNQLKNYDIDEIICKQYSLNDNMNWIMTSFYYSKYWEWLDTFFLIMFEKPVSDLHYYHHASTPFLSYVTVFYQGIIPSYIYACALNGFVHTLMYWYYAYPRGLMNKYKKIITKAQILQHCYMVFSIIYIFLFCNHKAQEFIIPMISGFVCYSYYLVKFMFFYLGRYKIQT